MQLVFIIVGLTIILFLAWLFLRIPPEDSLKTTKTVLSSDTYTKVLLTIIAAATSIIALQGFLD